MYQKQEDIAAHMPYLNARQVKHACNKLVKKGVIIKGNHNKIKLDRTNWYAFVDEKLFGVDEESSRNLYERQICPSGDKNVFRKNNSVSAIPDTKEEDALKEGIYRESGKSVPTSPTSGEGTKDRSSRKKVEEKKELPKEASELAQVLWERIKDINPTRKDPDFEEWAKEIELMNRRDKRSWEEIKDMIFWVFDDAFWYQVIQSPSGLRKNWDKMVPQMRKVDNKGLIIKKNRDTAYEVMRFLSTEGRSKEIYVNKEYVTNTKNGDSIKYDLPSERFEERMATWFGLVKV